MSTEKTLTGQATEQQVADWKSNNKYGIYAVSHKGHIAYFRVPDLNDLNCAYAKQDFTRQFDKWKELANVTWLGGSEELLNNDRMFISIVEHFQEMGKGEESELVNL